MAKRPTKAEQEAAKVAQTGASSASAEAQRNASAAGAGGTTQPPTQEELDRIAREEAEKAKATEEAKKQEELTGAKTAGELQTRAEAIREGEADDRDRRSTPAPGTGGAEGIPPSDGPYAGQPPRDDDSDADADSTGRSRR